MDIMSETRRNSVDVPLSRTLVALKRVRSLRDPDTNPMNKFSTLVDNINGEIDPCSNRFLEFRNVKNLSITSPLSYAFEGQDEEHGSNSELDRSSTVNPKHPCTKRSCVVKIRRTKLPKAKLVHELSREHARRSVDSRWAPHSTNLLEEEADSYSEPNLVSVEKTSVSVSKRKSECSRFGRTCSPLEDGAMSREGSLCISVNEPCTNRSSRINLGLVNDDVDVVDSNYSGCGLSYCWSRTPRYRESNLPSDAEDQEHPLLSAELREVDFVEPSPLVETPRCLSQKFKPRRFTDLVGQNVVVETLLKAIAKGKIAPMYLFHGPRGTGKTSAARIFAAALNCLSLKENRPCGFCQECVFLFSGKSRDVKELDAAKINRKDRIKALLKSASLVPFSSRLRIFIIDDCECLLGESWTAILNNLQGFSRHTMFVMITSDLDKLPRRSLSQCQKHHFPKIKDADIVARLQNICTEEGLDFDCDALELIAAKSNGSLRDAETMVDQLGLLGKKITPTLVYELVGVVSDDELLDLLEVALSSDTSNTVRRARELMESRVDPMQLVSQLANLIMDILAGRSRLSDVVPEINMQKLRNALKILSETEKQLRTSKSKATWLTVALLQFNNGDSSCWRTSECYDDALSGTTLSRESLRNYICFVCKRNKSNCMGRYCDKTKLETIWRRTTEECRSSALKRFLQNEGCLSSIYMTEGIAIVEVEFCDADHLSRAQKSWKTISSSFQNVLACDVEIRLNLVLAHTRKRTKVKKLAFGFFSCSGKKQKESDSILTDENDSDTPRWKRTIEASASGNVELSSSTPFNRQSGVISSLGIGWVHCDEERLAPRIERDSRSTVTTVSKGASHDDLQNGCKYQTNWLQAAKEDHSCNIHGPTFQRSCSAKTEKFHRKFSPSDVAHAICFRIYPPNKTELSVSKSASFDTYVCASDPHIFCPTSNEHVHCNSGDESMRGKNSRFASKLLCWRGKKSSSKVL